MLDEHVAPVSSDRRGAGTRGVRSTWPSMIARRRVDVVEVMAIGRSRAFLRLVQTGRGVGSRDAEEAARPQDQDHDERRIKRDVARLDRQVGRPERLEQPDGEPAEQRAGHRADAADDRGDQRLEAELESAGEAQAAVLGDDEQAGQARQGTGEAERDAARRRAVDPEERRRAGIVGVTRARPGRRRSLP